MEFNKTKIEVKENQNLVEIEGLGSLRFVPWSKNNRVSCYKCDLFGRGFCKVIPCQMSYRGDYKDGVFQFIQNSNH